MRRIFIFLLINTVFSQFDWIDDGAPIRQGQHIEWQRTAGSGEPGEIIFAWSDTRFGGRDIYAQKVDVNGNNCVPFSALLLPNRLGLFPQ